MVLWSQLLLCLAVIAYAGYFLSRYGDIIAEKSGISAVTYANTPNIAVGYVPGLTWVGQGLLMLYVINSWILFGHAQ